ncbi:MAG: RNA 2',3'-cyclic phosphodiesterase [Coxiellaceae bacterium]|jgi:2'-5' RNA ligase|nr:RNA 2',3'-cyclic phosphodiesterase [Coxiellaceae bacterium]
MNSDITFRTFLAVDIPKNIKKIIFKFAESLRKHQEFRHIKWTKQENFHITLIFLGNITKQQYQTTSKKIEEIIIACRPFTMNLVAIEPFPSLRKFHALILKPDSLHPLQKLVFHLHRGDNYMWDRNR